MDREEFLYFVSKRLPTHCVQFVTRIVGVRKDEGPADHRGTALLAKAGDRCLVITALHVLIEIEQLEEYSHAAVSALIEGRRTSEYRIPELDVVVWEFESPLKLQPGKDCWPVDQADPAYQLLIVDTAMVVGFPARHSRFTAFLGGQHSSSYSLFTWLRPRERDLEEFDELRKLTEETSDFPIAPEANAKGEPLMKPKQFAINYIWESGPLKTLEGTDVIDETTLDDYAALYLDGVAFSDQKSHGAYGLSGSPVWRIGASDCDWDTSKWSEENAQLAGIVTSWNEGHDLLVVTPINEILSSLRERGFPAE